MVFELKIISLTILFSCRTREERRKRMKKLSCLWMVSALCIALLTIWGCAKKVETATQAIEVTEQEIAPPPFEEGTEEARRERPPVVGEQPIIQEAPGSLRLADIYFDFDRSEIRPDARRVLENNARWFRENPSARVKIEGHCDERGTNEYNIALGQRRAEATKRFLAAMGVDSSRISTMSYGEERPVCSDHQEGCWQQNRRSHFLTVSR
jgi:peptidoglycan-associated lipoprotein